MIVRLRQMLGDANSTCIRSVRGIGYQWGGDED
jgi:DNA-binding response OmpR family regulator